jgi:Ca2+/Na+ antiporter
MDYDPRQFLDLLLIEYKSEESRKARRNVSVVSFVVIVLWAAQVPIQKMNVLGVPLAGSSEVILRLVAVCLLVYWILVLIVSWRHDAEIQKERANIIESQMTSFQKRFEKYDEQRKATDGRTYNPEYGPVKAVVEAYTKQRERTRRAAFLVSTLRNLELYIPLALGAGALTVLVCPLVAAL